MGVLALIDRHMQRNTLQVSAAKNKLSGGELSGSHSAWGSFFIQIQTLSPLWHFSLSSDVPSKHSTNCINS